VKIGSTLIDDTFAEAFGMRCARLIITAHDEHWLQAALGELCGYSASVIACDAEVGIEQPLAADQTPDGRPGASVLAFGFSAKALTTAVANRVGQCVMTCPTTAVFDGFPAAEKRLPLGKHLRYFGDGFQKSKRFGDTRYWRIPVMDGEFLAVETVGIRSGVAGGNLILQATCQDAALASARRASDAVAAQARVIAPFPGGVARSGSKVGSVYQGLKASTADAYCPTLRGRVETRLHPGVNCAYEIVIDGVDAASVAAAMAQSMQAAAGDQIVAIGAGNYGGKLGKFHFQLHTLAQQCDC